MSFGELHFLRWYWLPALVPLSCLVWRFAHRGSSMRSRWAAVCDAALLPYVLIADEGRRRRWSSYALGAAGTLSVLALAGPTWDRLPQPVFRDQSALVIALDLSRSMDAADVQPSRLERARFKIADLLARRPQGQTALLVFADQAYTVTPLTDDTATIASQLPVLTTSLMPTQGSRPDRALDQAAKLLQQAGVVRGDVLLVTDGWNAQQTPQMQAQATAFPHRISILGVGTGQGAPVPVAGGGFVKDAQGKIVIPKLDAALLRDLARAGGGVYSALRIDDRDLDALSIVLESHPLRGAVASTELKTERWREQGPWLLLLVLPLAALAFRRGYLVVAFALLPRVFEPVHAMDWGDLWSRPDQRAMKALDAGDPRHAAQRFIDARWQAAAHYRGGEFGAALQALDGLQDVDDLYNKGNALARLGRYAEAIQAYDDALKLDAAHDDARHNRDLLKKLLKDQQQQAGRGNPQEAQGTARSDEEKNQEGSSSSGQAPSREDSERDGKQQQAAQPAEAQKQGFTPRPLKARDGTEAPVGSSDRQEQERAQTQDRRSRLEREEGQADEQWLRRIPDDPGGLLRRKFLYQYQRQDRGQRSDQPW